MLDSHHPGPALSQPALATLLIATTALLILAGCGTSPTIAALRSTPTRSPTSALPLGQPHMVPMLAGISLVSPGEGWVIGRDGYYNGIGAFLLHLHNGSWQLEPFPRPVDAKEATPTSIAMATSDTGWIAATLAPDYTPVILQESAGHWLVDRLPTGTGTVIALSAPTAQDAWALTTSTNITSGTPTSAILRYRDGQWATETTYPNASLRAISMDSPDDGWTVGNDAAGPVLLHYKEGDWTRFTIPKPGGIAAMTGIFIASPSVGWATGLSPLPATTCTECGGGQQQRVVLQFRNGRWQQVQEAGAGGEDLPYTFTSEEQILPDSVAASTDGSGWLARQQLVYFAPNGRQQVFRASCQTDFLGMALVPASVGAATAAWVIGSNGQLFHLVSGTLMRYNTGAPCDPLS
jgi:hypothetical protein